MNYKHLGGIVNDGVSISIKPIEITYSIDIYEPWRVAGWCLPDLGEDHATLIIEYVGKFITECVANKFRSDLVAGGMARGDCGFDVDLSDYGLKSAADISIRKKTTNETLTPLTLVVSSEESKSSFGGLCTPVEPNSLRGEYTILHTLRPALDIDLCPAFIQQPRSHVDLVSMPFDIRQGEVLSTNTYFNAFFRTQWESVIGQQDLWCFVLLKGDVQINFFSASSDGNVRTLCSHRLCNIGSAQWFLIPLPSSHSNLERVRIYFEVHGISESQILGVHYALKNDEARKSSLWILLRTFKRKSDCSRLIKTILSDERFNREDVKLVVHDASNDINADDFVSLPAAKSLYVFKDNNFGSSGNLNRLRFEVEELGINSADNDVVVIIDDDVHLDPETILRSWSLMKLAREKEYIVSGAMLDKMRPLFNDSLVGIYGRDPGVTFTEAKALSVVGVLGNYRVDDPYFMNLVTSNIPGNMAAFYFIAMRSKTFLSRYLCPFFLKYDDVEYTYSMYKEGVHIENFSGIAVWHDSFGLAMPIWQDVLNIRHGLICDALHQELSWSDVIKVLIEIMNAHIRVHDYDIVESMIKVSEDFLEGPSSAYGDNYCIENENLISELAKKYNSNLKNSQNSIPNTSVIISTFDRGERIFHVNKNEPCEIVSELWPHPSIPNLGAYYKFNRKKEQGYLCIFDSHREKQLSESIKRLTINGGVRYETAVKIWRKSYTKMTSKDFWKKTFAKQPS